MSNPKIVTKVTGVNLIEMAERILFTPALIEQIKGGAARDLYPEHVAANAELLLEEHNEDLQKESK